MLSDFDERPLVMHMHERNHTTNLLNAVKKCFAYVWIESFRLCWRSLKYLYGRPPPAKDHYYIMKSFRALFGSYNLCLQYPNPLIPEMMINLKVNLCENTHQWFFRLRGRYDLQEIYLLAEGMKNAGVFVDVGSGIGLYSIIFCQAFPTKRVVAVEPLESNFGYLKNNIACNGITNCQIYQKAVSSQCAELTFYINPIHDGGGSLVSPKVYKTGDVEIDVESYQRRFPNFSPSVQVETISLDNLVTEKSIVKIDVEGGEIDVLRSGYDVLKRGFVELMIVEVMQHTVDDVVGLLDEVGFDCFVMPDYVHLSKGARLPWFVRNIACAKRKTGLEAVIWQRCRQSAG